MESRHYAFLFCVMQNILEKKIKKKDTRRRGSRRRESRPVTSVGPLPIELKKGYTPPWKLESCRRLVGK